MTQEIDKRITRARSVLIMTQPFFGTLALHLQPVERLDIETMAVDGKHLFYNPAFLDTLSEPETEGVLAHEVLHCAYKHHTRKGHRDGDLWNQAGDYAINRDLIAGKFVLPPERLYDARFTTLGTEEIYRVLEDEQKNDETSSGGKSGDPAQDAKDCGRCGAVIDAAPDHAPAALAQADAEWDNRVRQALAVAAASNAGSVPASLKRLVEATREVAVDWRETLRRFVDGRARCDVSWASPNKRMLSSGFILPGNVPDGLNHVALVVDTSGSINQAALSRFAAEMQAAIDEGAADRVTVIYCDAAVKGVEEFQNGDELKLNPVGGGGTRFSPAFEWIEKNANDASAVIYFTDMECTDFGVAPSCPVLWAAWGNPVRLKSMSPPFGEMIQIV